MLQASYKAAEVIGREDAERQVRRELREPIRRWFLSAIGKSTAELTDDEAAVRDLILEARAEGREPSDDDATRIEQATDKAKRRRGLGSGLIW